MYGLILHGREHVHLTLRHQRHRRPDGCDNPLAAVKSERRETNWGALDQLGDRRHDDEHQHGCPDGVYLPAGSDPGRDWLLLQCSLASQSDRVGTQRHGGSQQRGDECRRPVVVVQVLDHQQRAVAQEREGRSRPGQRRPFRRQRVRGRMVHPMTALAITNASAISPTMLRPTAR